MSNWMLTASQLHLTPVWERLHTELFSRDVLHADETTLQVLQPTNKKSSENQKNDKYFGRLKLVLDNHKVL